ncbi:MAG: sigma-70 family RNA polymerase sigma factor [Streptosporangiaceae bacterium]
MGGEAEDLHGRDDVVARLYYQYRGDLVRLAFGLTGDAGLAEEIVQEAFAQLLAHSLLLRNWQAAPAYLRQTVVNGARASWRRRRRRELVAHLLGSQTHTEGPDVAQQSTLLAALGQLPIGKRSCLLLRYYADLSEAETAHVLGVSTGTVKSQTAKGLRQLHGLLEPTKTEVR